MKKFISILLMAISVSGMVYGQLIKTPIKLGEQVIKAITIEVPPIKPIIPKIPTEPIIINNHLNENSTYDGIDVRTSISNHRDKGNLIDEDSEIVLLAGKRDKKNVRLLQGWKKGRAPGFRRYQTLKEHNVAPTNTQSVQQGQVKSQKWKEELRKKVHNKIHKINTIETRGNIYMIYGHIINIYDDGEYCFNYAA